MRASSDLAAYSVLLLVATAAADGGKGYGYPYTDLSKSNQDLDEMHELQCVDCRTIPKLATVHDDDALLLSRTTPPPPNGYGRRGIRQTTVVKIRGGVSLSSRGADFDHMETEVMMIPVVNHVQTSKAERITQSVAASNHVFNFRWNDVIKKTTQTPQ